MNILLPAKIRNSLATPVDRQMQWRPWVAINKLTCKDVAGPVVQRAFSFDLARETNNLVYQSSTPRAEGQTPLNYIDSLCRAAGFDKTERLRNYQWHMFVSVDADQQTALLPQDFVNSVTERFADSMPLAGAIGKMRVDWTSRLGNDQIFAQITAFSVGVSLVAARYNDLADFLGAYDPTQASAYALTGASLGAGALKYAHSLYSRLKSKKHILAQLDELAMPTITEAWIDAATDTNAAGYRPPAFHVTDVCYPLLTARTDGFDASAMKFRETVREEMQQYGVTPIITHPSDPNFAQQVDLILNRRRNSDIGQHLCGIAFEVRSPAVPGTALKILAL